MYKELEKYKTGNKIDSIGILPDNQELKIKLDEYSACLWDLIQDFIKHETKPFWKRKYYHTHLTKLYLGMLNKVVIFHGL